MCASGIVGRLQMFQCLTCHKQAGRRWVSKEQYIRFFMMCTRTLMPDSDLTLEEQREGLEVCERARLPPACCVRALPTGTTAARVLRTGAAHGHGRARVLRTGAAHGPTG
jgi:hypothetical protein